MRPWLLVFALASAACTALPRVVVPAKPVAFGDFFVDRTLRVDYHHTGNAQSELFALDALYDQGAWAGSRKRLIGQLGNGRYAAKLYDKRTGMLLFARAFDSIFGEYRSTTPAEKGVRRSFHESALVPFPKGPVRFAIEARGKDRALHEVFTQELDPADDSVRRAPLDEGVRVVVAHESGDPHGRVDIAILRRFCRATGAMALVKLQTPQADELGFAKQVRCGVWVGGVCLQGGCAAAAALN